MIISRDEIETFVPRSPPRLVILGTMGSGVARTLDGNKPQDAFFYHSPKNHFWRILQLVFEPSSEPRRLSVKEKKEFLDKWQIAMANIVEEITINANQARDPADSILFRAHKKGNLKFKKINGSFVEVLRDVPIFFTCKRKREILGLLDGYFKVNKLDSGLVEKVRFLLSPTRCNPKDRSHEWKIEIEKHLCNSRSRNPQ